TLFLAVGLFIISCRKQPTGEQTVPYSTEEDIEIADMFHNAENSLEYWGTYDGTLPSADGTAVHIELTLNQDKSFIKCTEYTDRNPVAIYNDTGVYVIHRNLLTLHPEGKEEYYKVEENRLRKLNEEKQEVEGEFQDRYLLVKNKGLPERS
ncbi:MAG: copper resistance protein NlpE, partial [Tannerellaceae bacterium]|nr:copper resistance protein NlpE [Tannerellaceae bacterium]